MISRKAILGISIAGAIAVSSTMAAFAAVQTGSLQKASGATAKVTFSQITDKLKSALDSLVTVGTITKTQEDAIAKVLPTADKKGGRGPEGTAKSPFASLVTAGTLTQAQSDAVQKAMDTARGTAKTTKAVLDALVTAGTITQVQEDAIVKVCPVAKGNWNRGDRQNPGDKKGGHGTQGTCQSPFSSLVTAGTITQAQADAIQKAMEPAKGSDKTMKSVLDSLVTAGTITQAQEDAIVKAVPARDDKAFSARDGKGGPAGMYNKGIASLVSSGTITQTQADKVAAALKTALEPVTTSTTKSSK